MSSYQSPIPLPDGHMRLVGIIAAHWEWAETILQRAIAEVAEHDWDRVRLLTTNIGYKSKCDLLTVYARPLETAEPAQWKRFTKAIDRLNKAYTLRNLFVHASWKIDRASGALGRSAVRTKGGKLLIIDEPVETAELEAAAKEIWDATAELTAFLAEYEILVSSH